MDKRLVFIVVGLAVIIYLVGNKAQPELVQTVREKVTSVVTGQTPSPSPGSTESSSWDQRRQEVFSMRVAESKRRAIAKYPDIAMLNTEMNSRFVFRYKWMVKENDERLRNPDWPEALADDCATAAGIHAHGAPAARGKLVTKAPVTAEVGGVP